MPVLYAFIVKCCQTTKISRPYFLKLIRFSAIATASHNGASSPSTAGTISKSTSGKAFHAPLVAPRPKIAPWLS